MSDINPSMEQHLCVNVCECERVCACAHMCVCIRVYVCARACVRVRAYVRARAAWVCGVRTFVHALVVGLRVGLHVCSRVRVFNSAGI